MYIIKQLFYALNKYEQLFSSGMTLSQLKDAVLSDRLFPKASQASGGVAGRSLAWKVLARVQTRVFGSLD